MVGELGPIDVSTIPELAQLVDEVRATGEPRRLRRDNEDLAVLVPVSPQRARPTSTPHPRTAGRARALRIAERTAGALKQYRRIPPATREDEKAAFAQAVAEEVAKRVGE